MPFKHKASKHSKFQKARYKIKNWKQYNEALRQRGNVTFWFSEEAIANWTPEKTGRLGRPQTYSDIAIEGEHQKAGGIRLQLFGALLKEGFGALGFGLIPEGPSSETRFMSRRT